ncbi:MAG: helix-turn-helix domain-containing protein [Candidatus Ventricola sp.]
MLIEIDYRALGRVIVHYRVLRRMTQEALADSVGLSAKFISNIERGVGRPSFKTIACLCVALEIEPQDLLSPNVARKVADDECHALREPDSMYDCTLSDLLESESPPVFDPLHPCEQRLFGVYDIDPKYAEHL